MSTEIKRRRGTTTQHASFTGALGELTVDTTKDVVVVHDGSTAGGWPMAHGLDFSTRADFTAAVSGKTYPVGTEARAAGFRYVYQGGTSGVTGATAWHPVAPVYPDHFSENTTPGTTNMRDAIAAAVAYSRDLKWKQTTYLCDGSTITLSADFTWISDGSTNGYGGGTTRGTVIVENRTTAGDVFKIEGASSSFADRVRSRVVGIAFKSKSDKQLTDLTGVTVNLWNLKNTFLNYFTDCIFDTLNVTNAVTGDATGLQNGLFVSGAQVTSIGDARSGFSAITGQYTYGNAINMQYIPDSCVSESFIEYCGRAGMMLGSNCRSLNNFVDLCERGYDIFSYRAQIIGGTCKWHQHNGVYVQASATDWLVMGTVVIGNNYSSAVGISENFAFRLTTGNTGWRIANINAADALSVNHPSKTDLQNFIHLGGAGNAGEIDNITISTPATGGTNFYDVAGLNMATGDIKIGSIKYVGTTGFVTATAQAVLAADIATASAIAMTAGKESVSHGLVQSSAATTLFAASRTAFGPFFLADDMPTVIADKTGGANTGAISVDGFAYRAPYVHTGGGGSETNIVAPAPDKFLGHLEIAFGDDSTRSFFYAGHVKWDGSTLTEMDTIQTTSSIGSLALSVSGGNLLLASTTSTAQNGKMIVRFRGTWMQAS